MNRRSFIQALTAMGALPLIRPDECMGLGSSLASRLRMRPVRSMRQFALVEIRLPSGPRQGLPLSITTQPFSGLLLNELDRRDLASGGKYWKRINITAPRQSGKTLWGSALPVLYHTCEVGETVIYGVPD